jgi:hypothetical protein
MAGVMIVPSTADLAEVLFASTLQASEAPTAIQIRTAVEDRLRSADRTACAAYVAQEAGDHPDEFARRMHWALAMVRSAYDVRNG